MADPKGFIADPPGFISDDEAGPPAPAKPRGLLQQADALYQQGAQATTRGLATALRHDPIDLLGMATGWWRPASELLKRPAGAPDVPQAIASTAAGFLVPQDLTEVGIEVGTLGAGKFVKAGVAAAKAAKQAGAAVPRLAAALTRPAGGAATRIAGATAGGAAVGSAGDEGALSGAFQGALTGTAGETLGAAIEKGRRMLPGRRRAIADADAVALERWMHETAPGLDPRSGYLTPDPRRRPSERLYDVSREEAGAEALGLARDPKIQAIDNVLRGESIIVPSMGMQPVTLAEANAELSAIGKGLRHQNLVDPSLRQSETASAYKKFSDEIRAGLQRVADQRARQIGEEYLRLINPPRALPPASSPYVREEVPGRVFESGPLGTREAYYPADIEATRARLAAEPKALPPRRESSELGGPAREFEAGRMNEPEVTYGQEPPARVPMTTDPTGATLRAAQAQATGQSYYEPLGVPPATGPRVEPGLNVTTAREVTPGYVPTRTGGPEPPRTAYEPVAPREGPELGPARVEEDVTRAVPGGPPSQEAIPRPGAPESAAPSRGPEAPFEPEDMTAMWQAAQQPYGRGMTILQDILSGPGMFREGMELNFGALQSRLRTDAEFVKRMRNALGPERYESFVDTVTRGAGVGEQDVVKTGGATLGSVAGGRNTASWAPYIAAARAALPGLGDRYIGAPGRVPGTLDPDTKMLIDLFAESALLKLGGGQQPELPPGVEPTLPPMPLMEFTLPYYGGP